MSDMGKKVLSLAFFTYPIVSFTRAVPWRNGEDVGLVYQGLAVRAPPQEIFHSNSGIAVLQKA